MQIDNDMIPELLRSQGNEGSARQAQDELPGKVDTDKDAGLLEKYGIDVSALISRFGSGGIGGSGGLGGLLK
jgi:hypothetical protein